MDNFIQKLGGQKVIIIAVIFLVVILAIVLFSFFTGSKQIQPQGSVISPTGIRGQDGKTLYPEESRAPSGWQTFKGDFFSISYPSEYSLTVGRIKQDGDAIILTSGGNIHIIEVQVYDTTDTSVAKISSIFKSFGLTESGTQVGNIPARKFQGKALGQEETAVVFESVNKIYKFQLMYKSLGADSGTEETFSQIVQTFQINPAERDYQ